MDTKTGGGRLAMIAADAVFLPTGFLRWAGRHVSCLFRSRRPAADAVIHPQRSPDAPEPAAEPAVGPPPSGALS